MDPEKLAEAVAQLEAFIEHRAMMFDMEALRLVLAALAEAQRERDEAHGAWYMQQRELAAAQAEAAKLREALGIILGRHPALAFGEPGANEPDVYGISRARAALAAPPSAAATPEGK